AKVVSRGHVVAALANAQRSPDRYLGERLVGMGMLSEADLAGVVAHRYGLELVDLREVTPDPAAISLLNEAAARDLAALPLAVDGAAVTVAVAVPSQALVTALQGIIGRTLVVKVARQSDLAHAIGMSYRALSGVASHVQAFHSQNAARGVPSVARVDVAAAND